MSVIAYLVKYKNKSDVIANGKPNKRRKKKNKFSVQQIIINMRNRQRARHMEKDMPREVYAKSMDDDSEAPSLVAIDPSDIKGSIRKILGSKTVKRSNFIQIRTHKENYCYETWRKCGNEDTTKYNSWATIVSNKSPEENVDENNKIFGDAVIVRLQDNETNDIHNYGFDDKDWLNITTAMWFDENLRDLNHGAINEENYEYLTRKRTSKSEVILKRIDKLSKKTGNLFHDLEADEEEEEGEGESENDDDGDDEFMDIGDDCSSEKGSADIQNKLKNMKFFDIDEDTKDKIKKIPEKMRHYITCFFVDRKRCDTITKHRRNMKNIIKLKRRFVIAKCRKMIKEAIGELKVEEIQSKRNFLNVFSDYKKKYVEMMNVKAF